MRTTPILIALTLVSPACIELDDAELSETDLSDTEQSVQLPGYSIVETTGTSTGADKLVRANCSDKTVVLGSSWRATDLAGTTIDTVVASASAVSATSPGGMPGNAWLFLAHSTTNTPYNVHVRLVCATAPAGFQLVTSSTPPTNSSTALAVATCPTGKQVTGGGYTISDSSNQGIAGEPTAFFPTLNGASWVVGATPPRGTPNWTLTAYALCADAAALPGYQIISAQTPVSVGDKQLVTSCPKSIAMTSAGWAARHGSNNALVVGRATLHDIDPTGGTVQTNAQNRSGLSPKWSLEQRAVCLN
ncbi:MAG: hypothetical protein ACKV2T_02570 [Kofleriaceae bacterium]